MRVTDAAGVDTSVPVWEAETAAELSAHGDVTVTLPQRAHQVTVRFITASGHQHRDVMLFADDYPRRKEDGSLAAYLEIRVIPRLKREWYPFPADLGDRWVLPVLLAAGAYVPDDDAPSPLDSYSASFGRDPQLDFPEPPLPAPRLPPRLQAARGRRQTPPRRGTAMPAAYERITCPGPGPRPAAAAPAAGTACLHGRGRPRAARGGRTVTPVRHAGLSPRHEDAHERTT
jgi:hypothetical protein